ncbi:MAG: TetR/AcrR family transcriptional regulator [Mycobacterium sp.]
MTRAVRRDAQRNRERILAAAATTMASHGRNVPLASIADAAGVGVGTFYRGFPDRTALLHAMEYRAYELLIDILVRIEELPQTGAEAVHSFLVESLGIAERLVLPLHGAPPLLDEAAVAARQRIDAALESFLAAGRADGTVRQDVNATDVIMCSALTTQPLQHGPNWQVTARRHIALFVAGIRAVDDAALPGPAVGRRDIEETFRQV